MIIKSIKFCLATAIVFVLILQGCVNKDLEKEEANEKKIINQYLETHPEFTKTSGGIYFHEDIAGTGLTPVKDDTIFINYVGRYLEDGLIRETSYDSLKDEWTASTDFKNYLYGPALIIYGYNMLGIIEALSLMKEGGKATVILPSDKANYDHIPLLYEIELVKVVKDFKAYDDTLVNKFLESKNFPDTTVEEGQRVWLKPGALTGQKIKAGDTVYLYFEGRLLDGFGDTVADNRVFDSHLSGQPLKFIAPSRIISGSILNQKIPDGLVTALKYMQIGQASIVIGWEKAFGANGVVHSKYNYTIIPKNQSVVYDVEVTQIKSPAGK